MQPLFFVYTYRLLPLILLTGLSWYADRVFVHALNTVKKIPRTGTARPPPAERLKLYGLYKQSMGKATHNTMLMEFEMTYGC